MKRMSNKGVGKILFFVIALIIALVIVLVLGGYFMGEGKELFFTEFGERIIGSFQKYIGV